MDLIKARDYNDFTINKYSVDRVGARPGLVVKGRNSYPEVCEFESQRQILDGHFSQ